MKYPVVLILIVIFAFLAFNLYKNNSSINTNKEEDKLVYKKISQSDAKKMMDEGGVIVLDVRTAEEFAGGHIPNALNHSSSQIKSVANTVPDKGATILVYCRSGARSQASTMEMLKLGYTNVIDFGGIMSWKYDIVR